MNAVYNKSVSVDTLNINGLKNEAAAPVRAAGTSNRRTQTKEQKIDWADRSGFGPVRQVPGGVGR